MKIEQALAETTKQTFLIDDIYYTRESNKYTFRWVMSGNICAIECHAELESAYQDYIERESMSKESK